MKLELKRKLIKAKEAIENCLAEADKPNENEFRTPKQASKLLNLTTQRVYQLIKEGKLKIVKLDDKNLIPVSDIEALIGNS